MRSRATCLVLAAAVLFPGRGSAGAAEPRLKKAIVVKGMLPQAAAFSPDGKGLLVSGITGDPSGSSATRLHLTNVKRVVALVEAQSGKVVRHLLKGGPAVNIFGDNIAFSPDGRRVFWLGEAAIEVWDAEKGKRVASWGNQLSSLAFSPDRSVALAERRDGGYEAFALADGRSLGTFAAKDRGKPLPLDPERLYLLLIREKRVVLLNLKTAEEVAIDGLEAGDLSEVSAAFSPDGRRLALGRKGGAIELRDVATGAVTRKAGAAGPVRDLTFSPDGSLVAYETNGKLCLWAPEEGSVAAVDPGYAMGVGSIAFAPDSRAVAAAGTFGADVKVWDLPARAGP
jgi:WD40 repeat protein